MFAIRTHAETIVANDLYLYVTDVACEEENESEPDCCTHLRSLRVSTTLLAIQTRGIELCLGSAKLVDYVRSALERIVLDTDSDCPKLIDIEEIERRYRVLHGQEND